jgi:flagellar hook-length control protein FliK
MSDNFLSFIGKAGQSSIDKGAEKSPLAATNSVQGSEFKQIFSKETVSPEENSLAKDAAQWGAKPAPTAELDEAQELVLGSATAPFGLPVASDNGNLLPKLSIYSPGLQVGRVILTTSSPKVNEDSLTAFARAQGINEAVLKHPQSPRPQTPGPQTPGPQTLGSQTPGPQTSGPQIPGPQTLVSQTSESIGGSQQFTTETIPSKSYSDESTVIAESNTEVASSILSGLLSKSALRNNPAERTIENASQGALTQATNLDRSADSTLSALRALQAFSLVKPDAKTGDLRPGSGELVNPMASTMIGAHDLRAQRQQIIRGGQSAEASKDFAEKEVDGSDKASMAKIMSEKLSISDLRQARQAIDSAMEFARSNVQNREDLLSAPVAGESAFAASSTLAAPPVSALQGATTNVAPVTTSLGGVLSANDPSLMQARMQPYQDWAEKFGEVLGQKLSLAVKQGTWAIKLNLNPHSLGEIAISLEVGEKGIEGQLSANDGAVRQLMSDALPKLRASLEDLFGQSGNVNIEVGSDDATKDKQSSGDMVEIAIDLEDEIFNDSKVMSGSGITLRDGFDVLV